MRVPTIVLPEFTRAPTWVNPTAQAAWDTRISRAAQAFNTVERLAVFDGMREAARQTVQPDQLTELCEWAAGNGLLVDVLSQHGATNQYATHIRPYSPGQSFFYMVSITTTDRDRARFREAYSTRNDDTVGGMLGYPACCRAFFVNRWKRDQWLDLTWPQGVATSDPLADPENYCTTLTLSPALMMPETNTMLRWLGVRLVSHLPCSFRCEESRLLAARYVAIGSQFGLSSQMADLLEMVRWPVEWSALHGVAEVKHPLAKLATRTDYTAAKYTLQVQGDRYPGEGGSGVNFPFQRKGAALTETRAYALAFERPAEWRDNGFASKVAMEQAHAAVLDAAAADVARLRGVRAVDFGCGNGRLLQRLCETCGATDVFGVEADPDRAAAAHRRLAGGNLGRAIYGQIADVHLWDERFGVGLITPGRLLEMDPAVRGTVARALRARCASLLVYAYADNLLRDGQLQAACAAAGLNGRLAFHVEHSQGAAAWFDWE